MRRFVNGVSVISQCFSGFMAFVSTTAIFFIHDFINQGRMLNSLKPEPARRSLSLRSLIICLEPWKTMSGLPISTVIVIDLITEMRYQF